MVRIADGKIETRNKLNYFLEGQKVFHPERKLKTLDDAINFLLLQCEKVEKLEEDIEYLREAVAGNIEGYRKDGYIQSLENQLNSSRETIAKITEDNMKLKQQLKYKENYVGGSIGFD